MSAMGHAFADEFKHALRGLLRKPSYVAIATLTLALGVGTVSLVYALLDQALLKPLPFPAPGRLVTVGVQTGEPGSASLTNIGAPSYYALAKGIDQFDSVGTIQSSIRNVNVALDDSVSVVSGAYADKGYLDTLGVKMALGRNFNDQEDAVNGPLAAILSHELWMDILGGNPSILQRSIKVEGRPVSIIGILPKDFVWPDRFDLLLPLQPDPSDKSTATNQHIVARLKDGSNGQSASSQVDASLRQFMRTRFSEQDAKRSLAGLTFGTLSIKHSVFASRSNNVFWMFFAAAVCVLAIAGVNLANLMLLRTVARDHETAIRVALGASGARLAAPVLAEAVLIGISGATVGLAGASVAVPALARWIPSDWIRGQTPELGPTAIGFSLVAAAMTALLGAMIATLRGRRETVFSELSGGAKSGLGRGSKVLAKSLIVIQIAAATILLLGAMLFARSLQKLSHIPMGFSSNSIVTFNLAPLRERARDIESVSRQTTAIVDALERQAEIEDAGASTNLPTGSQLNMYVEFESGVGASVQFRPSSQNVRSVFGIPLIAGRDFDDTIDRQGSIPVCIVSESLAKTFLGGNHVGAFINLMTADEPIRLQVVGIVGDVRQFGPAEPAPPILYVPLGQVPDDIWTLLRDFRPLSYAVKVLPGMESSVLQKLPDLVRETSPDQPISAIETMTTVVEGTTREQRLNLFIIGVFSALALLLAAVGIYAVISVSVANRTHEFGVRAALGATPVRLLFNVLMESLGQLVVGLLIGLMISMALSRILQKFLYQIGASDPAAIGMAVAVLVGTGVVAAIVPAWRASRVHPIEALRAD